MNKSHQKLHWNLLVQITPSIHLGLKLASKGLTTTFVNTQVAHHQITKSKCHTTEDDQENDDIFAGAHRSGLDICYKTMMNLLEI